jgi:hypothetical protein
MKPFERLPYRVVLRGNCACRDDHARPLLSIRTLGGTCSEREGRPRRLTVRRNQDEPAPTLIVDPPLPDLLDKGVVWIQWRAESDINTIDLAGMLPGRHKVRIELVNTDHEVFPRQSKTVTFTVPKGTSHFHSR